MKKAAFFDIDGTIFRSSLFIELVEAMIAAEVFPRDVKKGYEKEYRNWLDREGSYEEYLGAMVKVFSDNLKGVPYDEFMRLSDQITETKGNKVYVYTRGLIKELKKRGYFLVAISQSPKGVLDSFCKRLGFDKVYGRFFELGPSDQFTGETEEVHLIANKANIVRRAITKEGLTLNGSYAVGDTESDIPMLELVENPVCFNPNASLYRIAKINKWKVVVERKDVIYHIQ
ncbi:MAG: HAD-IB family hydrolase [Candidatus Taylorbacteria bacterium]|nr:HAD-IB family hydrolase [Candidatus Taylorbacteria bacterium]